MILDKYGLTEEAILEGDYAEFDSITNNRKEKRETYLKDAVDTVVQDTFSDLREVLNERNELREQLEHANQQLADSEGLIKQTRADAGIKQSDEAQLKRAENVLADLEHQVEQFKQKRSEDTSRIASLEQQLAEKDNSSELESLRQQIRDLEQRDAEREADYQKLADDVNDVLDSLEARFSDLRVD